MPKRQSTTRRPFGEGIEPPADPVKDLLRSLGYNAVTADAIVSWVAQRGGKVVTCPVILRGDVPLVEAAITRSKASVVCAIAHTSAEFEPTPEERGAAAEMFERDWSRRLGLVPSLVKKNRRTRQYSR